MKLMIKLLVIAIMATSSMYPTHAMELKPSQFSWEEPNKKNDKGETILFEVTQLERSHEIEGMLTFFLTCPELDLNVQNHEGYTALRRLLPQLSADDSVYLSCAKLFLKDQRIDIAFHEKTINEQFLGMLSIAPYNDQAFFNRPLLEYLLTFVNDKPTLENAIKSIEGEMHFRPNLAKEYQSFLDEVENKLKHL